MGSLRPGKASPAAGISNFFRPKSISPPHFNYSLLRLEPKPIKKGLLTEAFFANFGEEKRNQKLLFFFLLGGALLHGVVLFHFLGGAGGGFGSRLLFFFLVSRERGQGKSGNSNRENGNASELGHGRYPVFLNVLMLFALLICSRNVRVPDISDIPAGAGKVPTAWGAKPGREGRQRRKVKIQQPQRGATDRNQGYLRMGYR
jgi:hypothetical protein